MNLVRANIASAFKEANELGICIKVVAARDQISTESLLQSCTEQLPKTVGPEASTYVTGEEFETLRKAQSDELAARVCQAKSYLRTDETHKEEIVKTLQNSGRRVAVAGGSTDHVPALRQADCGIYTPGSSE